MQIPPFLVFFFRLFIEQWGDMRREVRYNLMAERIPTLRNVQANFSQGRLVTVGINGFLSLRFTF